MHALLLEQFAGALTLTEVDKPVADRDQVAVGELDPGFGNHPALLALTQNGHPIAHGPELVVIDGHRQVTLSAARLHRTIPWCRTYTHLTEASHARPG